MEERNERNNPPGVILVSESQPSGDLLSQVKQTSKITNLSYM